MVVADRQTEGRGRLGRNWASPVGGLWMSVIAKPEVAVSAAGRLGAVTALAGAEAASAVSGLEAELKWPNDVLVEGRKAGGTLVETEVRAGRVMGAVLSLGLNVNVEMDDLPAEIRGTAVSLLEASGNRHSLEQVAARALEALERLWPAVTGDGSGLAAQWKERDALAGADVTVAAAGTEVSGRAAGIDDDGALLLGVGSEVTRVSSGEIQRVRGGRGC